MLQVAKRNAALFAALLGTLSLPAEAASVAVGRDQSLEFADPSIVRVEVLDSQNLGSGDPAALVTSFTGQGPCLTYVYDDASTLAQEVRLALFDANDNVVGLPIVTVTNGYYNAVDASCGPVVVPPPPVTNEPPVAVDDALGENYEGVNLLGNDIDPDGDPLTARLASPPGNGTVTVNPDGSFSYVPDEGYFGPDSFSYLANDGELDSTSEGIVTLSVVEPPNSAPVAANDNLGEQFAGANVLANDSDPDNDPLTAVLESGPQHGSLTLNTDGTFSYTPETAYAGPESFSYRASDGEALSDIARVSFVVSLPDENLPPVASADDFQGDYENGNLLDNDLDPNRDPLVALLVSGPEHGELELNQDGTFSYRPYAGYAGPDAFVYKVRDRALADPAGLESEPVTVSLEVAAGKQAAGGVTNKQDADGTSVLGNASPNELRVSRRIDAICPRLSADTTEREDLLGLCRNLRAQGTTAKQALTALKAITPEELSAIGKAFRVLSFTRFRNIGARIARVRDGSRGVSIAGLNLRVGEQSVAGRELDAAVSETLAAMGMGASADEVDELREYSRLGLFVRGDLSFGDQDETELESGFDFDAQTLTVGADYRITDNLFTGASLSVGQSEVEFGGNSGETTTDNYSLALYGSLYSGSGYVDGIVSYGWSEVETERNIVYRDFGGVVDRTARGETDGAEYYISFNAGYNFNWGGLNVDPLVRFFYLDGEVDPFREHGAGGWDLAIDEQGFESMSASAGGQISYTFLPSWGVLTPYLRLEYTREFEDSADGIRYRFANDNLGEINGESGMVIEPDDPDNSYLVYGAGLTAQFIHGISGFLTYQALGSYDNLSGEIVSFGLRWEANF